MESKQSETTYAEPWRAHMIEDVLPSLNQIGRNLAGVVLRPNDPQHPTQEEKAITKAAGDLLDLGQRFLSRCLDPSDDVAPIAQFNLDQYTEQQLMDALALKSHCRIINGKGCEVPTSHPQDSGSGGSSSS